MSKIENNDFSLNGISVEESDKIKSEMLRYRANGLSYKLTLLGILASVIAAFIGLNSLAYNWTTILKILMNIGIMLGGFLFAEKVKAYSKPACIGLLVIGVICALRIFWAPLMLFSGQNFGLVITDGAQAEINWLPDNGALRGTLAMIGLIVASASFIFAGVYGYIQSNKLSTYLNSLKDDRDLGGK